MTEMLRTVVDEGCVVTPASIHQILPRATAVVTVNSGVGFEALLYLKPVVCLGRADYSVAGWDVKKIEDLDAALMPALLGKPAEFIKQFLLLAMTKYQVDCGNDIGMKQHVLRALCWNYRYYPGTPQNVPCRRFCAEKMSLMLANSPTARQAEGYLGTRTRYLGSNENLSPDD